MLIVQLIISHVTSRSARHLTLSLTTFAAQSSGSTRRGYRTFHHHLLLLLLPTLSKIPQSIILLLLHLIALHFHFPLLDPSNPHRPLQFRNMFDNRTFSRTFILICNNERRRKEKKSVSTSCQPILFFPE